MVQGICCHFRVEGLLILCRLFFNTSRAFAYETIICKQCPSLFQFKVFIYV
ncbi:hypothetical protein Hanom_Chr10g00911681 [Helianthus anomalus]